MTGTDGSFALRRSRAFRVLMGVVFAGWAAVVTSFFVSAVRDGSRGVGAVYVAMLVYGVVLVVRTVRARVEATPETLAVHNPGRSRRLARADIAGFSTGRYQRFGQQTAYAELRDGGAVRLVALEPGFPLPGREGPVRAALDRLEAWRTGSAPAPGRTGG